MKPNLYHHDDFEAKVTILGKAEEGRSSPPFNGVRWDLCYADDSPADGLYMVWPDFFDERGQSLPTDAPLPVGTALHARFVIVNAAMRHLHQARIFVGTRFYCQEGSRRVAEGTVTRITGLHERVDF